jgi:hypothetical protein
MVASQWNPGFVDHPTAWRASPTTRAGAAGVIKFGYAVGNTTAFKNITAALLMACRSRLLPDTPISSLLKLPRNATDEPVRLVIQKESNFNPRRSHPKAMGLMQLMPAPPALVQDPFNCPEH